MSSSIIAQNLADLTAGVGPERLAWLPAIQKVEAVSQTEHENAIGFKILYGIGGASPTDSRFHQIWIYLHTRYQGTPFVEFASYDRSKDSKLTFYDGKSIPRIVENLPSRRAAAFLGVASEGKIKSLAKYYFLSLMRIRNSRDDELKAPFNVTITWIEHLQSLSRDFQGTSAGRKARVYEGGSATDRVTRSSSVASRIVRLSARQSNPSSRPDSEYVRHEARHVLETDAPRPIAPRPIPSSTPTTSNKARNGQDGRTLASTPGTASLVTPLEARQNRRSEQDSYRAPVAPMGHTLRASAPHSANSANPDVSPDSPLSDAPAGLLGAEEEKQTQTTTPAGDTTQVTVSAATGHTMTGRSSTVPAATLPTPGPSRSSDVQTPTNEERLDRIHAIFEQQSELRHQMNELQLERQFNLEKKAELERQLETVRRDLGILDKDLAKLDAKEGELHSAMNATRTEKEDFLGSMTYEEQLDFMYAAGEEAARKRQRRE